MSEFFGILFLCAVVFFFGFVIGESNAELVYKKQAIERGFAEYNTTNGVWQWKEAK